MKFSKTIFFCFYLFGPINLFSQVASFSQYNCTITDINPAYIANIDKDYSSLILRSQWQGNKQQCLLGSFTINRFSEKYNSSLGLAASFNNYVDHSSSNKTLGLEYGYRILFLNDFVLNFGARVYFNDFMIDLNNYHYKFEPKNTFSQYDRKIAEYQNLKINYGFIFQEQSNKLYAGFSIRDQSIYSISSPFEDLNISKKHTYSVQAMYRFTITRASLLFLFASYEKIGSITKVENNIISTIQPSTSYLIGQVNYYNRQLGIFGIGYKFFAKNYGNLNFRYSFQPGKKNRFTIGYSYDPKFYIQNDKIKSLASHEIYLKFKLLNPKY